MHTMQLFPVLETQISVSFWSSGSSEHDLILHVTLSQLFDENQAPLSGLKWGFHKLLTLHKMLNM